MDAKECSVCRRPKGVHSCGICEAAVCKKCLVHLEKDSFSFLPIIPKELSHKSYCGPCYDSKVAGQLQTYQHTMARAKQVFVYGKEQGEETRLMSKNEKPLLVEGCVDKDETLLRLAFLAAMNDFNTLLNVVITSKKVRDEGYQKTLWSGTGIPTTLDPKQIEKYK